MGEAQNKSARRILVFNPLKKFIGVLSSQLQAAKMLGVKSPTIKAACDGSAISTCNLYLRWWNHDIEIDVEKELGELTLSEYDKLCGVERKVYRNKNMNRTGMKYDMIATPEKLKQLNKRNENSNHQQI